MRKAKVYARNLAANWVGHGAALVVAFFMSPFAVHTLGHVDYGVWSPAGDGRRGGIKGYGAQPEYRQLLEKAGRLLSEEAGAQLILAACTEVGLALLESDALNVPVMDPQDVLAREAIRWAYDLPRETPGIRQHQVLPAT